MKAAPVADVDAAVAALWTRRRPMILDRVALLEEAVDALSDGRLAAEQCTEAIRVAHMLAGSVGTFGFPRGSELAREIERSLAAATASDGPRLASLVRELRQELPAAAA